MPVNGKNLTITVVGAISLYSGIKGLTITTTLRDLIAGTNPATETTQQPLISDTASTGSSSGGKSKLPKLPGSHLKTPTSVQGPAVAGAPGSSAEANQNLARMLVPASWRAGQQWADLIVLWSRESGWSNTADTRKTGAGGDNMSSVVFAYGIAQARPYNKMPKAGWPPDKGGQSDARTQIQWGIAYIRGRYGTPSGAWAHEQANDWY